MLQSKSYGAFLLASHYCFDNVYTSYRQESRIGKGGFTERGIIEVQWKNMG